MALGEETFRKEAAKREGVAAPGKRLTFNEFGQKVGCPFGLFDPVSLHDLAVSVDSDVPSPTRLALPVQDWGVCHVVVLKHAFFELALWREVFLQITNTHWLHRLNSEWSLKGPIHFNAVARCPWPMKKEISPANLQQPGCTFISLKNSSIQAHICIHAGIQATDPHRNTIFGSKDFF